MLLQQIVEALDGELDRLYQLRAVLDAIDGPLNVPPVDAEPVPDEPVLSLSDRSVQLPVKTAAVRSRKVRAVPGVPRVAKTAKPVSRVPAARLRPKEKTALKGPVPTGPVVVSASALAKEHAAKREHVPVKRAPAPPVGSLGSMIRALRLDGTA